MTKVRLQDLTWVEVKEKVAGRCADDHSLRIAGTARPSDTDGRLRDLRSNRRRGG